MFTEADAPPVDPKIVAAIRRTDEEHFVGKDLVAVKVDPGEDYLDAEALYTVWVIVNDKADPTDLGKRKLSGLISILRRALEKEGDDTFPVVRMRTERGAKQLGRGSR